MRFLITSLSIIIIGILLRKLVMKVNPLAPSDTYLLLWKKEGLHSLSNHKSTKAPGYLDSLGHGSPAQQMLMKQPLSTPPGPTEDQRFK